MAEFKKTEAPVLIIHTSHFQKDVCGYSNITIPVVMYMDYVVGSGVRTSFGALMFVGIFHVLI
jgi:hypothetical protein